MNILTIIPDESIPAWQTVVDKYNTGSGKPAVTLEQFAQIFRNEETARYLAAKVESDKLAMASNERLMALGVAVMAQPDKLDEIESVVKQIIERP